MTKYRVSFPHLGNYYVPLERLFTRGLDVEYVVPPVITKKTLELGSLHSPDFICAPFKFNMGNYIETIEKGADTLVQTGGVCRLRYYGELQSQILKDLGHNIRFITLSQGALSKPVTLYQSFKEINPSLSVKQIGSTLPMVMTMIETMDKVEDFVRKNSGFQKTPGALESVHEDFMQRLRLTDSKKDVKKLYKNTRDHLLEIPLEKPQRPIRVGVIGEYYTIMEPFSNHNIEKELAKKGIVVDRWINLTNTVLRRDWKRKKRVRRYTKYSMGATSMFTVDQALRFAKQKYDGIIHVKSFGCTPEMDAMPVLQNISRDHRIPILYFTFDSQTSDTGIQTRLEAFYDMIMMRKGGLL